MLQEATCVTYLKHTVHCEGTLANKKGLIVSRDVFPHGQDEEKMSQGIKKKKKKKRKNPTWLLRNEQMQSATFKLNLNQAALP